MYVLTRTLHKIQKANNIINNLKRVSQNYKHQKHKLYKNT